jgi:hypothetical protein
MLVSIADQTLLNKLIPMARLGSYAYQHRNTAWEPKMNATGTSLATALPGSFLRRAGEFVQAIRDAAVRADRKWPGRVVAFRHVDAVEGLDARTLRDIGLSTWGASRGAQREREALQTRIGGGYRG